MTTIKVSNSITETLIGKDCCKSKTTTIVEEFLLFF